MGQGPGCEGRGQWAVTGRGRAAGRPTQAPAAQGLGQWGGQAPRAVTQLGHTSLLLFYVIFPSFFLKRNDDGFFPCWFYI